MTSERSISSAARARYPRNRSWRRPATASTPQSRGDHEQEIYHRLDGAIRGVVRGQLRRPRRAATFRLRATHQPFPGGGRPTEVLSPDATGACDAVRRVRVDLCAWRRGEAVDGTGRALWCRRRALLTSVPTYMVYFIVQPMPGEVVVKQIVFDGVLMVVLGTVVAWLYRDRRRTQLQAG